MAAKEASSNKNQSEKGFNVMAILSLVFFFVFWPLGLVFSIIALKQIKKTGERGRPMAMFVLIFSIIAIIAAILVIALLMLFVTK